MARHGAQPGPVLVWVLFCAAVACGGRPATSAPTPSASGLSISIPRGLVDHKTSIAPDASAIVVDRRQLTADGERFVIRDLPTRARHLQVNWLGAASGRVATTRMPEAPLIGDKVLVQTQDEVTQGILVEIDGDNLHVATGVGEPTFVPRAAVRDIRVSGGDREVKLQRPTGAGEPVLLELSYQAKSLWWTPSYKLRAHRDKDRWTVEMSGHLTVYNKTGHRFPEAELELRDGVHRAPIWRGRSALTENSTQLEFSALGPSGDHAKPASLTGRVEYVARLRSSGFTPPLGGLDARPGSRRPTNRAPKVTRELLLPLPPGHPLAALPPGWASTRMMAAQPGDEQFFEGPLRHEYPRDRTTRPGGRLRVGLGAARDLILNQRHSTHRQTGGTVHRHRVTVHNRSDRALTVRIEAPISQARSSEFVSARPEPTHVAHDRLEFLVTIEPKTDEQVTYLLFYPG